jgi:hypothetical protein
VGGFAVELQKHSCLVAKLLAQSQQMYIVVTVDYV